MLVLTRKLNEQISIGQDITITVLRLKGNTVRIGIEAPTEVRVVRGELPRFDASEDTNTPSRSAPRVESVEDRVPRRKASGTRGPSTGLKPLVDRISRRTEDSRQELLDSAAAATLLAD